MSSHTRRQTKDLTIPDHVPVGAVIGKGGSYCKALRANHGVRCSVDNLNRKVTLKGSSDGVESAEDELALLFTTFAISNTSRKRVFEILVRDGPRRWWSFKKTVETTSDEQVLEHPYRLQQSGRAAETESEAASWIKEFREDDLADAMAYLIPSEPPVKIKVAFGCLCFELLSIRCKNPTIAWPELQKLRTFEDYKTRWSNYCNRQSSSPIADLMVNLEQKLKGGEKPQNLLSVHLFGDEGVSYDLKYHLVNGEWNLLRGFKKRYVLGTYDVILDNKTSLRVRAITREKIPLSLARDIHQHLNISIPDNSNFFTTKVTIRETAPSGMRLKSFDAKSKLHVDVNGLRFFLMYMNQRQDIFRLECRLAATEKDKLGVKDNETWVLLKKVLQMLPCT